MTAKTILRKATACAIALPVVAYLYVEALVLLPFGLIHYAMTQTEINYQSHKFLGVWWTIYTPYHWKYTFVFNDCIQDRVLDYADYLWNC